jgi:hypothetical protein
MISHKTVLEVESLLRAGVTQTVIMRRHGLHRSTVSSIALGEHYHQLTPAALVGHPRSPHYLPTPEAIEAERDRINGSWNERERRFRYLIAHSIGDVDELNDALAWTAPEVGYPELVA